MAALVVTLLEMFGIAHVLDGIHDVFERLLHFSEFVLKRGDACTSIATAFFQRVRDVLRQRTQVLDSQHMRQQIFDHGLVEGFGADALCLTRLPA
ncbi:hypothetical protein QQ056_15415 [Oscillatoria laete-virens NRMC-F 0139]|nr:hypothetical protein [Oscillatoria laete-virens]MDL5054927.1 hypothetical protein [Oscillatoria laete-virens NRMC-F 0139]